MRRKNVMLARPLDLQRLKKWPTPYIVQPKINGRRALVYCRDYNDVEIRSSEDHLILSLPSLSESLCQLKLKNVILDGELYNPDWSFQKLCSVVGRTNSVHAEEANVQFYCFDLVNNSDQYRRILQLISMLTWLPKGVILVTSAITSDFTTELHDYIIAGYEGIILRHPQGLYQQLRSDYMMKLKPRKSGIFRITGFEEAFSIHKEPKHQLGAFWLTTAAGESFKVGSGFTSQQRDVYWQANPEWLLRQSAHIFYQELSERGVPIFPIFRWLVDDK